MNSLWQGDWTTRARIWSGLVLFAYALTHFLNIGLGLFSTEWMHLVQDWRKTVTRSLPGEIVLYGALLIHIGLALIKLARRGTLRMPVWEAAQIGLGLVIPLLLIAHITFTRFGHQIFGIDDEMSYLIALIFATPDGWRQSLLLLIVWVHSVIGLHFWLRHEAWWRRSIPVLAGLAALVPAFALAGFLTEGRRMRVLLGDPDRRLALFEGWNWPGGEGVAVLLRIESVQTWGFAVLLALTAGTYAFRRYQSRAKSVRIQFVDGPEIVAAKGLTLLEMSRMAGVEHISLCGGRGRCTTCRVVVEEGGQDLADPDPAELRSLRAVGARSGTRLACQIRPVEPMRVYRVFRSDSGRQRDHASGGTEQSMAILFLDIRGFTERTNGQLPYDVVFLLNRFFDAIVPAIAQAGGQVDKYLGDGLLAQFEAPDPAASAKAGMDALTRIGEALERLNADLAAEGTDTLRIGVGLHLGELVMGEIGAAGNAPRTIIGETVNAASRLEAKTKDLGVQALISSAVLQAAGIAWEDLPMEALDLRGVREPVQALPVAAMVELRGLIAPDPVVIIEDPLSDEVGSD